MAWNPEFSSRIARCGLWLLLVTASLHAAATATDIAPATELVPAQAPRQYKITQTDGAELRLAEPVLPDISRYNESAARRRLDALPSDDPVIEVRRVFDEFTLSDFTAAERAGEWAKRQSGFPRAIFLKSGMARPDDIVRALAGTGYFVKLDNDELDVYMLRLPLVVEQNAILVLEGEEELRLSQQRGAFLVVDGKLFAFHARLIAWNEARNKAAAFRNKEEFRPFLVSWGGSELYLIHSVVESFGYFMSKSYGITASSYTPRIDAELKRGTPVAWLVDSEFIDMYYGFYCYHAKDLVLVGNTYRNNIVYAIDPHDYSTGIIIAANTVYGTRQKHGIIVSRAVTNSWIFNNRSFNNTLSGFAIDRASTNNLIAYNESFNNGSDGLTIYESSDNLIWENFFFANGKHGISARNSTDVRLYNNKIIANQRYGVYGNVADLSHTDRDFKLDPYASEISLTVTGGVIAANRNGSLSIDRPLSLEMYDIDLRFPRNTKGLHMQGALSAHHEQLMEILFKNRRAAILHPVGKKVD